MDGAKSGWFHAEVCWSELKLTRPESSDDYHKAVLVVLVDSCLDLPGGGRTGLKLPNPKVILGHFLKELVVVNFSSLGQG